MILGTGEPRADAEALEPGLFEGQVIRRDRSIDRHQSLAPTPTIRRMRRASAIWLGAADLRALP